MSSFINMTYICSQISLPACSILFQNTVHAKYPTRATPILGVNIYSPYTAIVLLMNIIMTIVLIKRTSIKYSFPSRKEMLIFLKVFLGTQIFDFVLTLGVVKTFWVVPYAVLVSFQVACAVTCFVSAMCTGLVWMLPSRISSSCPTISWFLTILSLIFSFFGCLLSLTTGTGEILFMLLYIIPFFFSSLFSFTQLSKLKLLNAEIWSYGSLLVTILLLFFMALTPPLLGMLIVLMSDRYLDGLFLIHVLAIFIVIKTYDLWCMDNEQEIECVNAVELTANK